MFPAGTLSLHYAHQHVIVFHHLLYELLTERLLFQEPIPTSLLRINPDLMSRAMKLFQVILQDFKLVRSEVECTKSHHLFLFSFPVELQSLIDVFSCFSLAGCS